MPGARANQGQSRAAARAAIGTTPGDMLDRIIERAVAARARYLDCLSKPQAQSFSPRRHQQMLMVIEQRLEDLCADREARKRPA